MQHSIENAPEYCPICLSKHEFGGVKPIVCRSEACVWKYEEMGLGINVENEVNNNPHVVDILVSLAYSAASSSNQWDRRDQVWEAFPTDFIEKLSGKRNYDTLLQVLNLIPPVREMAQSSNLSKMLAERCKQKGLDQHMAYRLLRFILATNRTHLIQLKEHQLIKEMQTPYQYKLMSSTPEHEKRFQKKKAQYGSCFLFHGSPFPNWHSIMRNGLRNKMCRVPGIYMANNSSISIGYMGTPCGTWPNSMFQSAVRCMAMVEVARDKCINPKQISISHDDDIVVTRFFFVFANPGDNPAAEGSDIYNRYASKLLK